MHNVKSSRPACDIAPFNGEYPAWLMGPLLVWVLLSFAVGLHFEYVFSKDPLCQVVPSLDVPDDFNATVRWLQDMTRYCEQHPGALRLPPTCAVPFFYYVPQVPYYAVHNSLNASQLVAFALDRRIDIILASSVCGHTLKFERDTFERAENSKLYNLLKAY
jgi:hypothetical protein